jgi:hypothetical protein
LLALLLAFGLLGALGATAAGDPTTPFVVVDVYSSSGMQPYQVSPTTLAGCPAYTGQVPEQHGPGGTSYPQQTPDNPAAGTGMWEISAVLQCLGVPVQQGVTVSVEDENGAPEVSNGSELVGMGDLTSPSNFENSSEVPIVVDAGGVNYYYRPWRGAGDYNARDSVTDNGPITIQVFEGSATLNVTASVSNRNPTTADTVTFTATVTPPDQNGLQYAWSFDGGASPSTEQSPTEQFNAGTYNVIVRVNDSNGAVGTANVLVTVNSPKGRPPPQHHGHPGGGNGNHNGGGPTGPQNSHGNTPGGGAGGPQPGNNGNGGGNGGRTPQGGSGGKSPTTTKKTSHHQGTQSTQKHHSIAVNSRGGQASGGIGSGGGGNARTGGSGTGTASIPSYPVPASAYKTKPHRAPPALASPRTTVRPLARVLTAQAELVRGRLISGLDPLPLSASPFVRTFSAPEPTAPPVRAAVKTSALPAIGGALVFVVLLGLGAVWELRGRRSMRPLRLST